MNIIFDGQIYKCVNITGPTHNYLGLEVVSGELSEEPLIKDNEENLREINNISSELVMSQVILALAEMRRDLLFKISIKKIEYCSSDTPSHNVYYEMTKKIIKYFVSSLGAESP